MGCREENGQSKSCERRWESSPALKDGLTRGTASSAKGRDCGEGEERDSQPNRALAHEKRILTLIDSLLVLNAELLDHIEDSSDEYDSGDARQTSSRSPDLALADPMRDVQARFELVTLRFDAARREEGQREFAKGETRDVRSGSSVVLVATEDDSVLNDRQSRDVRS